MESVVRGAQRYKKRRRPGKARKGTAEKITLEIGTNNL